MDTLTNGQQTADEDRISLHLNENEEDDDDDDDEDNNNNDNGDHKEKNNAKNQSMIYESDSIVKISKQPVVELPPTTNNIVNNTKSSGGRKTKNSKPAAKRRQTIDSMDLRQLVLRNNNINDLRAKFVQSIDVNKHQVIVDYNILAFMENTEPESDDLMEERMKKFIEKFKKNYTNVQHIEYKIDNKLYCAIDMIYFLPMLFRQFEYRQNLAENRKILDDILKRLDRLTTEKTKNESSSSSTGPPPSKKKRKVEHPVVSDTEDENATAVATNTTTTTQESGEKNIRLYSIGSGGDFYLMCRKKQNFVDGQKNLQKKYGKCKLLKTWNNRIDVKDIGKLILVKFPQMKWNARTNILTNVKGREISETDLVNHLVKTLK